jgi:ATP-binding cassette subfamily B protein RaxB
VASTILQTEAGECGLTCLAMIAEAHGRRETLSELRRRFSTSLSGVTLKSLMAMADQLGFSARAVRCELDELRKLQTPCILHWNMDHYVVLRRVTRRGVLVIADPAKGERLIRPDEASSRFTGIALELTPTPSFERRREAERLRLSDLWSRIRGLKPFLVQLILLSLVLQVFVLLAPLATQLVIDDVITRGDKELLLALTVGFGALMVAQAAIGWLRSLVELHAGQRLTFQLSGNLLRHLLRLPATFFERRHVGDILSRFGSLAPAQNFLTGGVISVALDALLVVPLGLVMLAYSPLLSGMVVLNLLVVFAVRAAAFPTIRRYAEENLELTARADTVFLETIRAARAIKLAGKEVERHAVWQNALAEQQNVIYRFARFNQTGASGLSVFQGLFGLALLYAGALSVIDGAMTLGTFFAFQAYAGQFSSRVNGLVGQLFAFRMVGLHLERLADIVHTDPEPDGRGGLLDDRPACRIEARGVSFRYGEHEPWIFQDLDLVIEPGESVALVGPSGGGKSTLLKLLIGLYAPATGTILIDGRPLGQLSLQSVRERQGVVMQDDQLLSGSIAENVAFFDPQMDMAKVEAACRAACVHDDISASPLGYLSLIGDMGSILSGGQRQRILLARALYRNPAMLFMDEGTANLDADLEARVMVSLGAMAMTRVMVAHREAAIVAADRVVVIRDRTLQAVAGPPGMVVAVS